MPPPRRLRITTHHPIDALEQRFSSPSLVPGMGLMSLIAMLLHIEEERWDQQFSPRLVGSRARANSRGGSRAEYPRIVITPAT